MTSRKNTGGFDVIIIHGNMTLPSSHEAYGAFVESAMNSGAAARREPGNVAYVYAADLLDPSQLHLLEIWRSQRALEQHRHEPTHVARMQSLARWGLEWQNVTSYNVRPRDAG